MEKGKPIGGKHIGPFITKVRFTDVNIKHPKELNSATSGVVTNWVAVTAV